MNMLNIVARVRRATNGQPLRQYYKQNAWVARIIVGLTTGQCFCVLFNETVFFFRFETTHRYRTPLHACTKLRNLQHCILLKNVSSKLPIQREHFTYYNIVCCIYIIIYVQCTYYMHFIFLLSYLDGIRTARPTLLRKKKDILGMHMQMQSREENERILLLTISIVLIIEKFFHTRKKKEILSFSYRLHIYVD